MFSPAAPFGSMLGFTYLAAVGDVPADLWVILLLDVILSGCVITLGYSCCCGVRSPGRPWALPQQQPPPLPATVPPVQAVRDPVKEGYASQPPLAGRRARSADTNCRQRAAAAGPISLQGTPADTNRPGPPIRPTNTPMGPDRWMKARTCPPPPGYGI